MSENVNGVTLLGQKAVDPVASQSPPPPIEIGQFQSQPKQLKQKFSAQDVEKLTKHLNEVMAAFDVQARFFVHQKTKDIVVRVINSRTNQLIREVPSVKMLDMVAKFIDLLGIMVDEKA